MVESDAFKKFAEMNSRLKQIIESGQDVDEGPGDKLRDEMDDVWSQLTKEERERFNE